VCVWDDLVDIPIAVPLRAPSAEMRRKQQASHHRSAPKEQHEEMDITALSTPPQKPQSDPLMNSPPLDLAGENRFNISRQHSAVDVRESEDSTQGPLSPATVQAVPWTSRRVAANGNGGPADLSSSMSMSMSDGRPHHRARMSYEAPRRHKHRTESRRRRYSLTGRRGNSVLLPGGGPDDDEGDLGYAANEDMDANTKRVIVERIEMVKSRNPVFTWC
jgi:hypothetical protein